MPFISRLGLIIYWEHVKARWHFTGERVMSTCYKRGFATRDGSADKSFQERFELVLYSSTENKGRECRNCLQFSFPKLTNLISNSVCWQSRKTNRLELLKASRHLRDRNPMAKPETLLQKPNQPCRHAINTRRYRRMLFLEAQHVTVPEVLWPMIVSYGHYS